MIREIFVKIEGYDDYYISNQGRVMSTKNNKLKYLSECVNTSGYLYVPLYVNKKQVNKLVHRLLGEAFIDNPSNLPQIDHIDGNRQNNNIDNLRWVTGQQNTFNRVKAKGYYWHKQNKKWMSYITVNKKIRFLGYFITEEEARHAYLTAKEIYHVI